MKIILLIFSLAFLFTACSSQNEYELEDKLMECFYNESQDEGAEIKAKLKLLEDAFIEYGILDSADGHSYISFYKNVIKNEGFGFVRSRVLVYPVNDDIICEDVSFLQDTTKLKSSKLGKLIKINNEIGYEKDKTVVEIAQTMLDNFDAQDFNHNYYKNYFFVSFEGIIDPKEAIITLPFRSDMNFIDSINSENLLKVVLDKKGEILINDEDEVTAKEVKQITKDFLLDTIHYTKVLLPGFGEQHSSSKKIISLRNDRGTNYKIYLEVYNGVKGAYDEIWNEKSLELFKKEFKDLERNQKRIIQKIYPQIISEAEPTDVR